MEPLESTLLSYLNQVPDFRHARGQRFAWTYLTAPIRVDALDCRRPQIDGTILPRINTVRRPSGWPSSAPDESIAMAEFHVNLLEALLERMPVGVAVFDRDYRLVRCNPGWARLIGTRNASQVSGMLPGTRIFDLEPGALAMLIPLFERAFSGETIRQEAVRVERGGIASYWDIVLSPLSEGAEVLGLLVVSVEATERALIQQNLEKRVEERTRELDRRREIAESLRDTLSKINSGGSLEEVLDFIVAQADELSESSFVALYGMDAQSGQLQIRALRGKFPPPMRRARLEPREGIVGGAVAERRVLAVANVDECDDVRTEREAGEQEPAHSDRADEATQQTVGSFKALLAVPLLTQNAIYGALAFYFPRPHVFEAEEIELASTFADQAALAIENALLRSQAAEMAKLAERDRLARDLHDAVSQTLFSASLIADVLPRLWERNPEAGRAKLDELRLLTRGALAEMRSLLLELRPDTLADVDLGDLCRHLASAFSGRTRVPVAFTREGHATLPPDVKETFYRVTQEALNNIAKHAAAGEVKLHLIARDDLAEVTIHDNGVGFDVITPTPGNLGLKIMRERAEAIQAALTIESARGAGTTIRMRWPSG